MDMAHIRDLHPPQLIRNEVDERSRWHRSVLLPGARTKVPTIPPVHTNPAHMSHSIAPCLDRDLVEAILMHNRIVVHDWLQDTMHSSTLPLQAPTLPPPPPLIPISLLVARRYLRKSEGNRIWSANFNISIHRYNRNMRDTCWRPNCHQSNQDNKTIR